MSLIDRAKHETFCIQADSTKQTCANQEGVTEDIKKVFDEYNSVVSSNNLKYSSTWLLERDLWLQSEKGSSEFDNETLSRGRIVAVNPGVSNIGREQRFIHYYIVVGEYEDTFIGIPITNMAYDKEKGKYYLRHFYEAELINPDVPKPFNQFRCNKPTVADVRNIAGLDKRRIVKNALYNSKKYVPNTYLEAIAKKIRETLAIL